MNGPLNQAFPIVAAALGNRLGVKVMVTGQTAKTDGERILIPAYDGNAPDYRDIAWGFLAHEAAHIRYTDFSIFVEASSHPIRKAILNILEDVRIERLLMRDYPGTALTIHRTLRHLVDQGDFCLPEKDAHPACHLQAWLLIRLRLKLLKQDVLKDLATPSHAMMSACLTGPVLDQLERLCEEVMALGSTRDGLALADRILEVLKAQERPSPSGEDATATLKPDCEITQSGSQGQLTQARPEDLKEADANGIGSPQADATQSDHSARDPIQRILDVEDATLQRDLFEMVREGLDLQRHEAQAMTLPVGDDPDADWEQGFRRYQQALEGSARLRAALQGWVQTTSKSTLKVKRAGQRITGTRLSRLGCKDTRVFEKRTIGITPDTAVHLLLDRSPSMSALVSHEGAVLGRRMDLAWDATLGLAIALEGIQGVNVGITAFPGRDGEANSVYRLVPHGVPIRARAGAFAGDLDGSTPLAEALWYAGAQLLQQRQSRRILLVLTDGVPDDLEAARSVLSKLKAAAIEVTGIGLGIDVDRVFETSICVQRLGDLPVQLNALCKRLLFAA